MEDEPRDPTAGPSTDDSRLQRYRAASDQEALSYQRIVLTSVLTPLVLALLTVAYRLKYGGGGDAFAIVLLSLPLAAELCLLLDPREERCPFGRVGRLYTGFASLLIVGALFSEVDVFFTWRNVGPDLAGSDCQTVLPSVFWLFLAIAAVVLFLDRESSLAFRVGGSVHHLLFWSLLWAADPPLFSEHLSSPRAVALCFLGCLPVGCLIAFQFEPILGRYPAGRLARLHLFFVAALFLRDLLTALSQHEISQRLWILPLLALLAAHVDQRASSWIKTALFVHSILLLALSGCAILRHVGL